MKMAKDKRPGESMTPFTVSSAHKYRIVGMTAQRPALPTSFWVAWCEGAVFGLPAGALLALPVALRAAVPFRAAMMVWLAGLGLLGLTAGLVTGMLRASRPLPSSAGSVPLAILLATGPLAFAGKSLHAATHHRPLGAATFAVVCLVVMLGALAYAARVHRLLRSSSVTKRNVGRVFLYAAIAVSLALGFREFMSALATAKTHPAYIGTILDGLLGTSLVLVGGFARISPRVERVATFVGPVAWLLCLLALSVGVKSPETSQRLAQSSALWYVLRAP